MNDKAQQLLCALTSMLQKQQPDAWARLDSELMKLARDFTTRSFFYLFAICPRWFAKQNSTQHAGIAALDKFCVTETWQYPQFARLLALLKVEDLLEPLIFDRVYNQLYDTADVNEHILLVQSMQFLPNSERFVARAREAARSNIASVFSAIAHRSDYAFRHFDTSGWNQLILKAAFLALPIWNICGLKERNNAELVVMLSHYAKERQAARRSVPWDLWVCIAWLAQNEEEFNTLTQQFTKLDQQAKGAILLSLLENGSKQAKSTANKLAAFEKSIVVENLSWPYLAGMNEH